MPLAQHSRWIRSNQKRGAIVASIAHIKRIRRISSKLASSTSVRFLKVASPSSSLTSEYFAGIAGESRASEYLASIVSRMLRSSCSFACICAESHIRICLGSRNRSIVEVIVIALSLRSRSQRPQPHQPRCLVQGSSTSTQMTPSRPSSSTRSSRPKKKRSPSGSIGSGRSHS